MEPDAQMPAVVTTGVQPGLPAAPQPEVRRRSWLRLPFRRRRHDPEPPRKGNMTWGGHLVELRNRLYIAALSIIPGTVLGFVFSGEIIHFLRSPLPTDEPLYAMGLTDALMIQMQVAIIAGIILAMPVILYEFWGFISPGLTPSERSAARPWIFLALGLFIAGVSVAYLILPHATGFLYKFQSNDIHILLTADAYFSFVTTLFLTFGLIMQAPILLVLLSKVGLVSSEKLRKNRRMGILGAVIISNLITPGGDFVSPAVMSVLLYGLYETSIVLIRMNGR